MQPTIILICFSMKIIIFSIAVSAFASLPGFANINGEPGMRGESMRYLREQREGKARAEAAAREAHQRAAREQSAREAAFADRERLLGDLKAYADRKEREARTLEAKAKELSDRYLGKDREAIQREQGQAAKELEDAARDGAISEMEPSLKTGEPITDAVLRAKEYADQIKAVSDVGDKSNKLKEALKANKNLGNDALDDELAKERDKTKSRAEAASKEARLAKERVEKIESEKRAEKERADREAAEKAKREAADKQRRDREKIDKEIHERGLIDRVNKELREGRDPVEKFEKGIRNA